MTTQNDSVAEALLKQNEDVCIWLGLWKHGQLCKDCDLISPAKHAELFAKFRIGHAVAAPDLLAPAGFKMLVKALLKNGHRITDLSFSESHGSTFCAEIDYRHRAIDGDLAPALLHATAKMLEQEKQAHA